MLLITKIKSWIIFFHLIFWWTLDVQGTCKGVNVSWTYTRRCYYAIHLSIIIIIITFLHCGTFFFPTFDVLCWFFICSNFRCVHILIGVVMLYDDSLSNETDFLGPFCEKLYIWKTGLKRNLLPLVRKPIGFCWSLHFGMERISHLLQISKSLDDGF